ncbi:MAG: hypothetical protein ACJ8AK_15175 [Gemmatimonadaceae bacterium]
MSLAFKTTDAPSHQPPRLSTLEATLRGYFVAAFTGADKPDWAFRAAVWNVTDDLKMIGDKPEDVIKRIKYIAAIPVAFHYRVGYRESQSRLTHTVSKATAIAIDRYFAANV